MVTVHDVAMVTVHDVAHGYHGKVLYLSLTMRRSCPLDPLPWLLCMMLPWLLCMIDSVRKLISVEKELNATTLQNCQTFVSLELMSIFEQVFQSCFKIQCLTLHTYIFI